MLNTLNKNIKDLITEFPAIVTILSRYNIGCTTCAIGTCRLKDIIEIHNLTEADEHALFTSIANVVFPNQNKDIPKLSRKVKSENDNKKMSPPLEALVAEHVTIKKVITAIPKVCDSLKTLDIESKQKLLSIIDFIRNYADKFHHAKEEDILFGMVSVSHEIITVMLQEHTIGRGYVKAILAGIDNNDVVAIKENLTNYGTLLTEHIRKEDEILYPWIDRELSDSQVGQLFGKFNDIDKSFGNKSESYLAFARTVSA